MGLGDIIGPETEGRHLSMAIFEYIEEGRPEQAARAIKELMSICQTVGGRLIVNEYSDPSSELIVKRSTDKDIVMTTPGIQKYLRRRWVIKAPNGDAIYHPFDIQPALDQIPDEHGPAPRAAAVYPVEQYTVEEMIVGPDVYDLFHVLNVLEEGSEFAVKLKDELADKCLDDIANLLTVRPDTGRQTIQGTASEKLLETLENYVGQELIPDQAGIARTIGQRIDEVSQTPLFDTGPWNIFSNYLDVAAALRECYRNFDQDVGLPIAQNEFDLLSVTRYLVGLVDHGKIEDSKMLEIFRNSIIHNDFDKVDRLTFLRDNFSHFFYARPILEHVGLEALGYWEARFRSGLEKRGIDYAISNPELEDFYRNLRMAELVRKDEWAKHISEDESHYVALVERNLRAFVASERQLSHSDPSVGSILHLMDQLSVGDL